jgi:hypothetical protein
MRGPTYDREFLANKIAMMRIKGKSTRFLIDFLTEEVKMGQTTAYEVLRESQKIVTQMQERHIEDAYADSIARLDELYEQTPDKRVRLQIQQELNKLQGLYKPNKVDVTTNGKDLQINEIVVKFVDSKNDLDE